MITKMNNWVLEDGSLHGWVNGCFVGVWANGWVSGEMNGQWAYEWEDGWRAGRVSGTNLDKNASSQGKGGGLEI